MKKSKKYLSAVLTIIMMCCTIQPLSAFAQTNISSSAELSKTVTDSRIDSEVYENNPADISLMATVYKNAASAIPFVQSQLASRKTSFTVQFTTGIMSNTTALNNAVQNLFTNAISDKYATKSTYGDYLNCSIINASHSSNFNKKTTKSGVIKATFSVSYIDNAAHENEVASKISSAIKALSLTYSSQYEKVWRVYKFVCDNTNLSTDSANISSSAYGAIVNYSANQLGYSALLYRMLSEAGIKSRVIVGTNGWVWNIVKIGSVYYNVDSTADDVYRSGVDYPCFLKSDSNFSLVLEGKEYHSRSTDYCTSSFRNSYPISASDYDYAHNISTYVDTEPIPQTVYSGSEIKPTFMLTSSIDNDDYYFSYTDNIKPEYGYVTVNGTNEFFGSSKKSFRIYCDHKSTTVAKIYPATRSANGYTINICDECGIEYNSSKKIIYSPKTVNISKAVLIYTGKNLTKPTVTSIVDTKGNKISSQYTVSYISRATGKAVSSVKGIGYYRLRVNFKKTATNHYSGYIDRFFSVNPKKPSIVAPSTGRGYVIAKWKKDTTATGYQVTVSTSSKFKSGNKIYTVKGSKNVSKKVTGLSRGKKYYVRVRTYRTCKADGKSYNLYGAYSATKYVKCK